MRIFITGGSGYLGHNFIEYALKEDPQLLITALSRSTIADDKILQAAGNVRSGKERIRIIRGDMHDENALREGVNEADVIVHLAAK
ncbi:12310_t:CDS:1, partial [Ambispora leptoticha]